MAGEQEWRTKCSTSAMSHVIITRKQENVIGQTEAHQGAPTTAWIVKRWDIQITIILSRLNCLVTCDSGRDCIKDVYISRNQLCSDLPKFPIHTDIGLCYRQPLPSPQNIGLGSLWDPISSTFISDLGLILGALSSTLISNISRDTPGSLQSVSSEDWTPVAIT